MAEVKTIKDVDDDSWSVFKSIAARNNMKMGKLFEKMVNEYKEKSKDFWDDILSGEKIISDNEADILMRTVKKIRSEDGFRK